MGKFTISVAMFNSYVANYQRVPQLVPMFWVNYNDLTADLTGIMVYDGESSPNGLKIQVSEIL